MIPLIGHIMESLRDCYPAEELHDLAYWVAEELTGMSRTELITRCKDTQNFPELEIILQKLRAHEPVQYIFAHTSWMGLDLALSPATLIPRPETAELVEWILSLFSQQKSPISSVYSSLRVADIGTGSGCIAIALKAHRPDWILTGIDISGDALAVAQDNGQRNHVSVAWQQRDILTDEIEDFDIIVSNPPYICNHERQGMDRRVLDYEPASALFVPDSDPLLFYRRIAEIKRGQHLFFEINEAYGEEVCDLLTSLGYVDVQRKQDMYGKERMVYGRISR